MPVAAAVWGAAMVTMTIPASAAAIAIAGWCGVAACLGLVARVRRPAAVAALLAVAAVAMTASNVVLAEPARAAAAALVGSGGRAVEATAEIVGKVERRATGELVFDAMLTRLTVGEDTHGLAPVPIEVRVDPGDVDDVELLDVGATVAAAGSTRTTDAGERAVFTLYASRGLRIESAPWGLVGAAGLLREGLVAATSGLPDPGGGLIPGLAVGDTSEVDPTLDADMKSSSLSHLTAVSGANCALVVGLAFAAAALCGASRRVRVVVSLAALGGFVVLVTPEPSVARAAVMAAVAMLAVALGRPAAGIAVLSLAVTLLLATDPWLSTSLGFALSTAATGALLLLARPLAAGLQRWMPRALALALSVPLAAQLACGPLLVLISPSVPVYGVVANLLAAPAAPVATIVGLAACLALPVPLLQSGLTAIAWLPAAWIAGTARTFADLPGGQIAWVEGWWGAATLAVVGAAGALVLVPRTRRLARAKPIAVVVVATTLGVSVGTAALMTAAGPLTLPAAWAMLACDVGQGDAVLIRSGGAVALVDTGPEPERVSGCLARAGIARLDLLVLTHFDLDHAGGVDAIVGRVDEVRHGPATSADDERLLARLAGGGARLVAAHAGQTGRLGEASWRILWPPGDSRVFTGGNDASVVLDVRGGGVPHALFLGDLSATPQRALAASGELSGRYDLVKVAHHGSADQDPGLYEAVDAAVAFVTVGVDNDYGHPREQTLDLLTGLGAVVARTDVSGIVAAWRSTGGVEVWREHAGAGPAGAGPAGAGPAGAGAPDAGGAEAAGGGHSAGSAAPAAETATSAALARLDAWPRAHDGRPPRSRAPPSRSSRGAIRSLRRSSSCPGPKTSAPSARRRTCGTTSARRTRASRCPTSAPTTTRRARCSRSRRRRSSASRDSCGSRVSRSAPTPS